MQDARAVRLITYRRHRLQVMDQGPGWSVLIYHPSKGLFRPALMETAQPGGLAALVAEAKSRIDDSLIACPGSSAFA
ncbi:hypothetical protein GXW71_04905 [Roseomonas hellenica]|uniref:Uncharacterized protein n=1 Tax=Plastoroseomonas hellenica TaxID=2687306 RepID=A0ABS5ETS1_9PROT|nr:hypothetical protein [Plastoroseomonas hellenica]MBR0663692.1 hypothetical protein [Plastoroseomonas hellenica]